MTWSYAETGPATWLVVIDMQTVFGGADSPWAAPRFGELIEPTRRLCEAYAPNVVFTRYLSPADPQGAWRPYFADWPFALQPPDAPLWDIVPELADLPGRSRGLDGRGGTLDAECFSKWGRDLAELAGQAGRLVLTGVSTDCCVIATALAAADAGVETWVVKEATTGIDDPTTKQALYIMSLFGPLLKIVSLDEALAAA
ncbi:MAG: cysteine hydrolase [Propionibacteriaceae bacterium]|jgi:nicotinamidase-related amidase|nr:cysteine hydrolase [Propionibacteriaceae bacterium]